MANTDRYEATRKKAPEIMMELRGEGPRVEVASYLPELLNLAHATGRCISAILALRYADLRLDMQPLGALVWSADADKMGREWTGEINATAREALDRLLVDREVGTRARWPASRWLFPSPRNAARPVSKDLASDWLERAEALAKLPKLDVSLWHAYRRGWATSRKDDRLADVAAAGGWQTRETLSASTSRLTPSRLGAWCSSRGSCAADAAGPRAAGSILTGVSCAAASAGLLNGNAALGIGGGAVCVGSLVPR